MASRRSVRDRAGTAAMTSWLRRKKDQVREQVREQARDLTGPDPGDRPEALLGELEKLNRFLNAESGRLPGVAVVLARQITDVLRAVIVSAEDGAELDISAVISIRGMLGDYLPTTLQRYLALDPSTLDTPRPSGRTPNQSLRQQLDSLYTAADDLLAATRAHDADALLSQGAFLRTKFSGSDLDL